MVWYDVLPSPAVEAVEGLLGPECVRDVVGRFNVGNVECISALLSKVLSLAIVVSAAIVKVPQIVKILRAGSAQGLSLAAYIPELLVYMVTVAYNFRRGYPFLTYGETTFLTIQDLIVILLIFAYGNAGAASRSPAAVVGFPVLFAAVVYLFADEALVKTEWLEAALSVSAYILAVSRLPQLYTNYANGNTGQIDPFGVFMFLAGSVTRIFTTLKEVPDPVILRGFILGAAVNFALSAQMVYYWNAKAPAQARKGAPAKTAAASGTPTRRTQKAD